MDAAEVFFLISGCAAAFAIGCSYIGFLRVFGLLSGDPRAFDSWMKWIWFIVWTGFILGLAALLV